jgi:DNA-binding transcriptional LysR family regulator
MFLSKLSAGSQTMIPYSIRQLEAFVWVAELGSFRKAADKLNTTQPAISIRISTLEGLLGVRLFERDTGSVRLTVGGRNLLPNVKKLIQLAEAIQSSEGQLAQRGVLRLGVAETIVHTWLPSFLKEFSMAYPLVDVDVMVDVTVNLRNELIEHKLDLAFLMGPISEYRVENIELPTFPLTWVCAPGFPIADRKGVTINDLLDFPVITYARTTRPYAELYRKFAAAADKTPRIFPVTSLAASLRMVLDGIGAGTLPQSMVAGHLSRGDLKKIECEWTPSELSFTASFSTDPPNVIAQRAAEMSRTVAEAWTSA